MLKGLENPNLGQWFACFSRFSRPFPFTCSWQSVFRLLLLLCLLLGASPLWADDPNQSANRTFTEAIQNIRRASTTYDMRESVRLLRAADKLLRKIVNDYPESTIAVQLVTNQFIGDFDVLDFRNRIRALSCEKGSYVEEFLGEHGIASATGPNTEACFLYRLETLLAPFENPPQTARWDWLSLSVAYYLYDQQERARQIILPFLTATQTRGRGNEGQDMLMMTARALMLTGQDEQAQGMIQRIGDCTARLSIMADMTRLALWGTKEGEAHDRVDTLKTFVEENQCNWQRPVVAEMLALTARQDEAAKLYETLKAEQFTNVKAEERSENTPPDLAVAAAILDEPGEALGMVRAVMEGNPWVVPQALFELGRKGAFDEAQTFVDELKAPAQKAGALLALIDAANKGNVRKKATHFMGLLAAIKTSPSAPQEQVEVLAARARAERAVYKDERWRETILTALNTADLIEENSRMQAAIPLIAALAAIKTGNPLLD